MMSTMRTYGQYCGVARAADVIGERWALLIVRDLLVRPVRFTELRRALGVPSNILTTRLKELESTGVVERVLAAERGDGVVYRLTSYGRGLEPIVDALGLWGARRMDERRPDERVSDFSLASALRVGWMREATRRTVWCVTAGPATAWAITEPGSFQCGDGEPPELADVHLSGEGLRQLLAGRIDPHEGLIEGKLTVEPNTRSGRALVSDFAKIFSVPLD